MSKSLVTPPELVLLFDECGTPSFGPKVKRQHFIGVSVLYFEADEQQLFEACQTPAGLTKQSAKKSSAISPETALTLAGIFSSLPIIVTIRYIDLSNDALRLAIEDYQKFGDFVRLEVRARKEPGVRERKIPQILHSHVLDYCLLEPLMDLVDLDFPLFTVWPFIDAWSIPAHDRAIYLKLRGESLQKRLNELILDLSKPGHVSVSHVATLDAQATHPAKTRKRFIDAITSVVSRSLRFSPSDIGLKDPVAVLEAGLGKRVTCRDVTSEVATRCTELRTQLESELRRKGIIR